MIEEGGGRDSGELTCCKESEGKEKKRSGRPPKGEEREKRQNNPR